MTTNYTNENRHERFGATDAAAALGLSPFKTAWELWAEKRGLIEAWKGNTATHHGNRLESAVLDEAEARLGRLERGVHVPADGCGFPLVAQLDARLAASGEPVDAKTTGIVGPVYGRWGEAGSDEVPDYYLVQMLMQMFCTDADVAHLFALIGGRGIVPYRIEHERSLSAQIVDYCRDWWKVHIIDGWEPERTTPPPLEVIKRLKRTPLKVATFTPEDMQLVERWQYAKDAAKHIGAIVDEAQAAMLVALGDAEAADLPDGRQLTYFEQSRKGYEVKPCTFRVARVTGKSEEAVEIAPTAEDVGEEEIDFKICGRVRLPRWWKRRLLAMDERCRWCRCQLTMQTATFEHLIPLAVGGTNEFKNLSLACAPCNHERGSDATEKGG